MTPVTSHQRIGRTAVGPVEQPRLFVVESRRSVHQRSATEMWSLAVAILSVMLFAGAMAKFVLDPAIATVAASSVATSSF